MSAPRRMAPNPNITAIYRVFFLHRSEHLENLDCYLLGCSPVEGSLPADPDELARLYPESNECGVDLGQRKDAVGSFAWCREQRPCPIHSQPAPPVDPPCICTHGVSEHHAGSDACTHRYDNQWRCLCPAFAPDLAAPPVDLAPTEGPEDDLSDCPYYLGEGACGYQHLCNTPEPEPHCWTDRPLKGWPGEVAFRRERPPGEPSDAR